VPEHAKTGAKHEVPLTPLMRGLIAGEPVTTSPLVFPSSRTGGRLKGWTKLTAKLRRASGVDFRLHDLRRTCRTLMSRLGVPEDLAELAIGHVRADLIARYNKDAAQRRNCSGQRRRGRGQRPPCGKSASVMVARREARAERALAGDCTGARDCRGRRAGGAA
jgi:integrase